MSLPRIIKKYPITWTDDQSQPIFVGDFRNIGITMVGTGDISVLGTADINDVDFTTASTIDNAYATIVMADETVANTYATSLTVTGSTKIAEVNTNLLTWVCVVRSAGTVDAFVTLTDNQ